jgi:hypothetical protein
MIFQQYLVAKLYPIHIIQQISDYVTLLEKSEHHNSFQYCLEEYKKRFELQLLYHDKYGFDPYFVNPDDMDRCISRYGYKRSQFSTIVNYDEIDEQCDECGEYYLTRTLNSRDNPLFIRKFIGKCDHKLYPKPQ